MSYSALGIANSGLGATILAVLLIRSYFFTQDLSTRLFLGIITVPIIILLNSYFHVYESEDLRQIADFWIIVAPSIWLIAAVLFSGWRRRNTRKLRKSRNFLRRFDK